MSLYEVFVDGAARGQGYEGNYGHGAIGVVITRNYKTIGEYARALGLVNNNQAEYEAIIHALVICWSAGMKDPIIYSDAQIVVNQINDRRCHNDALLPYFYSVEEIRDTFNFRIQHVPRKRVAAADSLANAMLNKILEDPRKK